MKHSFKFTGEKAKLDQLLGQLERMRKERRIDDLTYYRIYANTYDRLYLNVRVAIEYLTKVFFDMKSTG